MLKKLDIKLKKRGGLAEEAGDHAAGSGQHAEEAGYQAAEAGGPAEEASQHVDGEQTYKQTTRPVHFQL